MEGILIRLLFSIVAIFTMLVGCSSSRAEFDDKRIQFTVVKKEDKNHDLIFDITVKNNGDYSLKNTLLFLNFPIKLEQGQKSNPFKLEAKSLKGNANLIKPGEEVMFTVDAPISEVFTDTSKINIASPNIEFKGFVIVGNTEIPFGIGGGVGALDPNYE